MNTTSSHPDHSGDAERAARAAVMARAAAAVGSKSKLAELLNVTRGAITNWIARGIPTERAPDIERVTRSHGAPVTCEELCPKVSWHVVRGNPLH